MKFTEMPYQRPDVAALKAAIEELAARIVNAATVQEQIDAYEEYTERSETINTMGSLAYVRNTVNTKDEFYAAEREFYDTVRSLRRTTARCCSKIWRFPAAASSPS